MNTIILKSYRLFFMRFLIFSFFFSPFLIFTQSSVGSNGFAFLNGNYSARSTAMGGKTISVYDNDLSLVNDNPAILNEKMNGMIHLNQGLLPAGINFGAVNYAIKTKIGVFAPSVKYVNYGKFTETDETGRVLGNFSATDFSIGTNFGRSINEVVHLGANFQFLGSNLASFSAYGLSLGFGVVMTHPNELISGGLSVRNIGFVFKEYTSNAKTSLPIDVQAAFSFKLKHAPFRFSILGHRLNQWDIVYQDPTLKPTFDALTGDTIPVPTVGFGEKLANHFNFQLELLASKSVQLRAGFDYHRRQQLKLVDRPGLAGFSFGVGLRFKKISFDYGFIVFSKAGQNHTLGISTQISDWLKKKN
jgi:hypothetical protein